MSKSSTVTWTKVDSQGRVVIPAELRQELEIKPGSAIGIRLEGDQLSLFTVKQGIRRAQKIAREHTKGRTGLVDEFLRERRADSGE